MHLAEHRAHHNREQQRRPDIGTVPAEWASASLAHPTIRRAVGRLRRQRTTGTRRVTDTSIAIRASPPVGIPGYSAAAMSCAGVPTMSIYDVHKLRSSPPEMCGQRNP